MDLNFCVDNSTSSKPLFYLPEKCELFNYLSFIAYECIVPPKIAPFDFGSEPSNFGDSVSVQCNVNGDLPIDIKWYFDGRPAREYPGITTVKIGNRNSVLSIDSVTGKHAGHYTCQATNIAESLNFTSELIVKGIERLTADAVFSSSFAFRSFYSCFEFQFLRCRFHFILTPFFVSPQKCKIFTCLYFIAYETVVPPKIAPFDFGSEPSNFADSASVACLVTSGDMPVSFKWFFNNRPVKEFSGITTVKLGNRNSVLNIDSVTGKHAGKYTCEASNQATSINYTAQLIVNGTHQRQNIF